MSELQPRLHFLPVVSWRGRRLRMRWRWLIPPMQDVPGFLWRAQEYGEGRAVYRLWILRRLLVTVLVDPLLQKVEPYG